MKERIKSLFAFMAIFSIVTNQVYALISGVIALNIGGITLGIILCLSSFLGITFLVRLTFGTKKRKPHPTNVKDADFKDLGNGIMFGPKKSGGAPFTLTKDLKLIDNRPGAQSI